MTRGHCKTLNLYLPKDLYCRDFGVSVLFDNADGGPTPHVIVDLNGHTLYGSGQGRGVTAFAYPGTAYLQVLNGRVENFEIGVGGDNDTRISNVKLVGNHTGFFCNGGCWADQSYFKNNSVVGMGVGAEAYASVKHSTFSGNKKGAFVCGHRQPRPSSAAPSTTIEVAVHSHARLGVADLVQHVREERHRSLGDQRNRRGLRRSAARTNSRGTARMSSGRAADCSP